MKRLFLLVFIACFTSKSFAQIQLLPPNQPEQDACNALEICGNTFTSPYSYQGIGQVSDLTNTPCLGGEDNVMWFRMNIMTGGVIVFTISPLNLTDDYDFAVVNITGKTCSTFTQSDVIRCNFNNNWPGSNVNGVVGLNTTSTSPFTAAGATGGSFLQQINANPGDVYLIMINNFGDPFVGGPSSGFTIDFTGTTATFNGPTPAMNSIITSCNYASQVTLQMNHNILCNTIAANGTDFTVASGVIASAAGVNCSGTNGYTDKVVINFPTPLPPGNYHLVAKNGTDGNTLLNTCNIPLPAGDSIAFTVPPYTSPAYVSVMQPACQEIKIKLNKRISCATIAKNGSDFSISGPQSSFVIAAYGTGCDTNNFTDTVVLLLQSPLQTDGTYTIASKTGTDNNTLLDSCNIPQTSGDIITFSINSYDGLLIASEDKVLCDPQYLQLDAANHSTLPSQPVSCGLSTLACSGNSHAAFIGSKDSLSIINSPFFSSAQRVQYLFLASELKEMGLKSGLITSLQWKVTKQFSVQPYTNFTIKIACSALPALGNDFITAQQVYSSPSYAVTAGWNQFNLSTPFGWDGVSNLIIEVCYDNAAGTNADEVAHSYTPFTSVLQRSGITSSACAITTQGILGTSRNLRPKVRFYICEPIADIAKFTWTPGLLLSDSTIQQPLAYVNNNITYHSTVVDKFGCAHRDSVSLILSKRSPLLTPQDTTICFGEKIRLQASGGVSYNWLARDLTALSCNDCATPVATPQETSSYQVIIGDQYNCTDTLSAFIKVNPLPPVNILEQDMRVKYGSVIQLNGEGAHLFSWWPQEQLNNPNIPNPVATITKPVVFYMRGADQNGCDNIDSVKISVDYTDAVFIPSAFSPNGDGRNDIFKAGSLSFQRLTEFRIFNRWGEEVFNTTDGMRGWDGTYKGIPQEAGVYHYIMRIAYPNGKIDLYKGDVTLVR